mmetsp:Transcript_17717/g.38711  ORF Transcript_17717/g.38711 Transcript_17717/m.38711 type:complete len:109 (+) Transcript_17717:1505-1831(+)
MYCNRWFIDSTFRLLPLFLWKLDDNDEFDELFWADGDGTASAIRCRKDFIVYCRSLLLRAVVAVGSKSIRNNRCWLGNNTPVTINFDSLESQLEKEKVGYYLVLVGAN